MHVSCSEKSFAHQKRNLQQSRMKLDVLIKHGGGDEVVYMLIDAACKHGMVENQ